MKVTCGVLVRPGNIEFVERELDLADDEVLVETYQASICDADLRAYRGMYMPDDLPSFKYIGHEGGGTVVEIGKKVREFRVGDKVMLFGPHNSFSNYFKAPVRDLHPVPDGLPMEIACLGEPICVGMFGVFEANPQLGDTVVVAGLNFQGLLAVEGLKKRGAAKLIAVDYSEAHLKLALQRGADIAINSSHEDASRIILDQTGGKGADVVVHSCGYWNPRAEEYYNLCLQVTRDEGRLLSLPDTMTPLKINLHRAHHHALEVLFPAVMHHGFEFRQRVVPRLLRPIMEGQIDIRGLITSVYPLREVQQAMRKFDEDIDQVKVVLRP
ncbi:MAG: alcohol dehydrogenase catalytic domain-containing protein [Syntrophothermus sp.]|uniref:zinc-dependent alcohol dehydrogenase n=1 Tax=Syntrophothermus sp. TaxID=2736299 RepID=UPI00257E643C|nr:zinc-binding dehydrogenase [Syntrophothermus sp.]NSW84336.1 alcohol dehydrogenase catalytic domain-containing protein [Syntrophothermus sp.]